MKKIGSLYQVKDGYWLVFSSKEAAAHTALIYKFFASSDVRPVRHLAANSSAVYWNKRYNCNVSYISPNDIFVLLEINGINNKVLSCNGEIGWIFAPEPFSDYFEEVSK